MKIPSHHIFVQAQAVRSSSSQRQFSINIRQEGTEENKQMGIAKAF